jgi:hypothetical protein
MEQQRTHETCNRHLNTQTEFCNLPTLFRNFLANLPQMANSFECSHSSSGTLISLRNRNGRKKREEDLKGRGDSRTETESLERSRKQSNSDASSIACVRCLSFVTAREPDEPLLVKIVSLVFLEEKCFLARRTQILDSRRFLHCYLTRHLTHSSLLFSQRKSLLSFPVQHRSPLFVSTPPGTYLVRTRSASS